jgi:hypothetical protein
MNKRTRNLLVAAVVAVAALFVLAMVLSGGDDDDTDVTTDASGETVAQYQAVDVRGASLPRFESPEDDPAVGSAIPQLIGHSFDGTPVRIDGGDGTPKVILFLSHSCPHCQNEVRALSPWFDENGLPDGVTFVSVSTNASEQAPNWPPSAWLEDWKPDVLVDDQAQTAAQAYGLPAFPYWVFVDGDGNVVQRLTGELGVERVEAVVEELRSGG